MAKLADTQTRASELGITFDGNTTIAQLEKMIAEKEAGNSPADENTPPAEPNPPTTTPTPPAEEESKDVFDVTPNGKYQVVRSKDGKKVRMYGPKGQTISPAVQASDADAVERLGREASRHNAFHEKKNKSKK